MNPADDDRQDGALQRLVGEALAEMLAASGFAGGILIAVTGTRRVIPVIALPGAGEDVLEAAAELLRTTLVYLEAGRVRTEPSPLDTPNG